MKKKFKIISFLLIFLLTFSKASDFQINRISGESRYETSKEVSKNAFKSSKYVILASGENFPDALSATPLAHSLNCPILLTPSTKLPKSILKEILDLEAKEVIIVGSFSSISEDIEKEIKDLVKVRRIGAENRYETAALIAKEVLNINGSSKIAIASGENFPDALSSSAILLKEKAPIILTPRDKLPRASKEVLETMKFEKTYIFGGLEMVSKEIENELDNPIRISGTDRFDSSVSFAKQAFENPENIIIVNGSGFADALAAGSLVPKLKAPIILSEKDSIPEKVRKYLFEINPKKIYFVGGDNSVSSKVAGNILSILEEKNKKPDVTFSLGYNDEKSKEMLEIINKVRKEAGLYELKYSKELEKAAKIRAKEISVSLSHTRPDGSLWNTVNPNVSGENLIQLNASPEEVIKIQLGIEGQSKNIKKVWEYHKSIGVACFVDNDGKAFWVQVYGV
ncbi:cell wall-binding repeat-containing protein [Citroniella saccharovorans]|uniref:cell wall-binding repeat-containing protein n=1 Tax=Citroniella saccharovorans TaxID=2053367 RepID=UPI00361D8029